MEIDFSSLSPRSMIGRALRRTLYLIPGNTVLPVMQGPMRGMKWISGSFTCGCWLGSYEMRKRKTIERSLQRGDTFFDIGANVGFYTLLASRLVGEAGRVIAIEPNPRNLSFLKRHVELNKLRNVQIIEAAVADRTGYASFCFGQDGALGHIGSGPDSREVRTISIDDCVMEYSLAPSHLKIDVEGAEADVLRGGMNTLRDLHPTIFLATHGPEQQQICSELLESAAYRVREIEDSEFIAVGVETELRAAG